MKATASQSVLLCEVLVMPGPLSGTKVQIIDADEQGFGAWVVERTELRL